MVSVLSVARTRVLRWLSVLCAMMSASFAPLSAAQAPVVLLTVEGAISPATTDYAVRGIRKAADQGAPLVVIQLDTPGGLDTSMRQFVKEILASPVPVATFVAPGGARAASAGTFILYASHVAAMAPGTNLGAASPVQIGGPGGEPAKAPAKKRGGKATSKEGKSQDEEAEAPPGDTMMRKVTHDAAAYIRSLAQLRGRNADWGERAVREAVSLSAADALKLSVIDVVAQDVPELLKKLDGRKVTVQGVERKLATAGASTVSIAPDWRSEVLAVIANPSVALILMMIGIYGLLFEFANPGFVAPGVVGGICLLLALYALHMLPVNYVGVGLILLGTGFLVAEAFVPSFGALGIGGTVALVFGSVILIDPDAGGEYTVPLSFSVTLGLVSATLVFLTVYFALKARRRPVVSGREDILGASGEALEAFEREGWARVRGENWRVVSNAPLGQGQRVRVRGIDGLTLRVEPEPGDQ
ncbi:MAG TPA: nodulation protein NfeD [Burkholderiales bacterium]|nr:nodulation protein NfeD [Burkholderiales bacterium]